jgi:hypothetical protein
MDDLYPGAPIPPAHLYDDIQEYPSNENSIHSIALVDPTSCPLSLSTFSERDPENWTWISTKTNCEEISPSVIK